MQRPDMIRLMHMLDAAKYAWEFVAGRARGDLDTDRMLQFTLVRTVEIIGEAANQISAAGQAELSAFPWHMSLVCEIAWYTPTSTSISIPSGRRLTWTSQY